MIRTPPPRKLVVKCHKLCTFHPDTIGEEKAEILKALREGGAGVIKFTRAASELLDRPIDDTNVKRHFKHYRDAEEPRPDDAPLPPGGKVTDLEILNDIIEAGHRNSRSWKPTIKDTLDAMRLKVQLTGNSAFEDMIAAMDAALDLAEDDDGKEEEEENVEAVLSPDERAE